MYLLVLPLLAPAFSIGSAPTGLRMSPLAVSMQQQPLEEEEAPSSAKAIFTLEERGDGWDDVRGWVVDAKKDRAKAWDELSGSVKNVNSEYIQPTARLTKVLVEEAGVVVPTFRPAVPTAEGIKGFLQIVKNPAMTLLDVASKRGLEASEREAKAKAANPRRRPGSRKAR